jgi:hypothetical protein
LLEPDDVACVFYGDLFRPPGRMLGVDSLDGLGPEDIDGRGELDLLEAWWVEASRSDGSVVPPGTRSLGVVAGVQAALAALSCSRFLAGASERLLLLWLRQVRTYFAEPGVRTAIGARFAAAVGVDTQVVVSHSLGSVVAYEALCAHPEWSVRGLVTLGSPLGIRNVILDRLEPSPHRTGGSWRGSWPGQVRSWTNIADQADFVALVKRLRPVFGDDLVDLEIDNGTRMHDVSRYLTAAETGAAIVNAVHRRVDGLLG